MTARIALLLAILMAIPVSWSAYLESDPEPARTIVPEPPAPPRPLPLPQPVPNSAQPPLAQHIQSLQIGNPAQYGHLAVYPLLCNGRGAHNYVQTLDAALRHGWLDIRERAAASINLLRIRNTSRYAVFLMSGEIILGGKQNRTIAQDVLLPARSGFVDIAVYCVEEGRWNAEKRFHTYDAVAAGSTRKLAANAASQRQIWRDIDRQLSVAEVADANHNYQACYAEPRVRRHLDDAVSHLRLPRRAVGAVVLSNRQIVGVEIFSDPDTFSDLWPKLCRSYAMDIVVPFIDDHHHHDGHGHFDEHRRIALPRRHIVQDFLNQMAAVHFYSEHTPGAGNRWRGATGVGGTILDWQGSIVHATAFQ
jgi:hypothetical protein